LGTLIVVLCPGRSTHPVAASGYVELCVAATQIVCWTALTNVTSRVPAAADVCGAAAVVWGEADAMGVGVRLGVVGDPDGDGDDGRADTCAGSEAMVSRTAVVPPASGLGADGQNTTSAAVTAPVNATAAASRRLGVGCLLRPMTTETGGTAATETGGTAAG
jgi:hypothetical protein